MKAAELIWNSWKNGKKIETLPDEIMPHSRNEAYKIQEQIEVLSKNTILGWKIAATSKDGQNHIGVSGPLAGRIFRDKVTNPNKSGLYQFHSFGKSSGAIPVSSYLGSWTININQS